MLLKYTYREDAAAVVGLMQLDRRAGGLSGASFGPVRVAHCNLGGWRGAGRVEVTLNIFWADGGFDFFSEVQVVG
jgi:hypothetical protein